MQEFSRMAKREGICEATQDKVPNNADEQAFELVRTLPHSYHAIRYILGNIYMHTFAFVIYRGAQSSAPNEISLKS